MYYRRKVLLALIQVFGGELNSTDCEKLLFEFCKVTGKNHYDFFPYHYGPFSFLSYYDKRRLTDLGLLKPTQDFVMNTRHSYVADLEPCDKRALLALNARGVRGRALIRKTYSENPEFSARSRILTQLFNASERKRL